MNSDSIRAIASAWLDDETHGMVAEFNQAAQWDDTLPRPIEAELPLAINAMVVPIADLRARKANNWLRGRGREGAVSDDERPLRGCYLGWHGSGFIFVDDNDPPDERRYTIAHEVGHFLMDYLLPRQRAIEYFGPSFIDIMDGKTKPSMTIRFRAIFMNFPIGPCIDLMERRSGGHDALDLYAAENRADRVALALLAPLGLVLRDIADRVVPAEHIPLADLLCKKYGLPFEIPRDYSSAIVSKLVRRPSPYDRLVRK